MHILRGYANRYLAVEADKADRKRAGTLAFGVLAAHVHETQTHVMLSTSVQLPNEASWGLTLKKYDNQRKAACWEQAGWKSMPQKDHAVSHMDKRKSFNPLLSRYPDESSEMRLRDAEAAERVARLCTARSKQNAFDIVTHQYRRQEHLLSRMHRRPPRQPDSRAGWNIISHEAKAASTRWPIRRSGHEARVEQGHLPQSWQRREFDIVSNKYRREHESRAYDDRKEAKRIAQFKYWKTHDYDPVAGRYYDTVKEKEFLRQRETLSAIAGRASTAKLPPAVSYSEGATYDILNHAVKDARKLEVASGIGNRAITGKKGPAVERDLNRRVELRLAVEKARATGRFTKTVHLRERDDGRLRGYDVLTGLSRRHPCTPGPHSNLVQLQRSGPLLSQSLRTSKAVMPETNAMSPAFSGSARRSRISSNPDNAALRDSSSSINKRPHLPVLNLEKLAAD